MTDKKGSNPNRLNGKDLINAGIFSAIYVVIIWDLFQLVFYFSLLLSHL